MKRCEIDDKYKWDLSSIYKNDDEFNKVLDKVSKEISKFNEYHNLLNQQVQFQPVMLLIHLMYDLY